MNTYFDVKLVKTCYVCKITFYFEVINKMNIVSQATNEDEIEELKAILQEFFVSQRIKQLVETK